MSWRIKLGTRHSNHRFRGDVSLQTTFCMMYDQGYPGFKIQLISILPLRPIFFNNFEQIFCARWIRRWLLNKLNLSDADVFLQMSVLVQTALNYLSLSFITCSIWLSTRSICMISLIRLTHWLSSFMLIHLLIPLASNICRSRVCVCMRVFPLIQK